MRREDHFGGGAERLAHADECEAGKGDAAEQLGEHEAAAPGAHVHLRPRHQQEAAPLVEQHDLGADDDDQPDDGIDGRRPEHAGQSEQCIKRRHGDGGTELVAHEHGEKLVLELRLQRRAGGEARARFLEVVGGTCTRVLTAAPPRDFLRYGAHRHRSARKVHARPAHCMAHVIPKSRQEFLTKCLVMKFFLRRVPATDNLAARAHSHRALS